MLKHFVNLDDSDIWCALKVWATHKDTVLSILSSCLINRNLFKIEVVNEPISSDYMEEYIRRYMDEFKISRDEASYFCSTDVICTDMYSEADDSIDILYRDGTIKDISEASDMLNIQLLAKKVEKHYFSYLKI